MLCVVLKVSETLTLVANLIRGLTELAKKIDSAARGTKA